MMDALMLNVKFLLFFALEFSVLCMLGTVIIGGLYQIVQDKVRKSRLQDQIKAEPTTTSKAIPHHSG